MWAMLPPGQRMATRQPLNGLSLGGPQVGAHAGVGPPCGEPGLHRVVQRHGGGGRVVVARLMRQAALVDVQGGSLVAVVLLEPGESLVQVLEVRLLLCVVVRQVIVRTEGADLVLLDLGGHGVMDVLARGALPAAGRTRVGIVRGLVQGPDLCLGLGDGVLSALDLAQGLPDLVLQAPTHRLVLRAALLDVALHLGDGVVGHLLAACDELPVLVAQRLGPLLAVAAQLAQLVRILLPIHLVPGGLVQRQTSVGGLVRRDRGGQGHVGPHGVAGGLVAALRVPEAGLVDAQRLLLMGKVVLHLSQRVLKVPDDSLGLLHVVSQPPLCFHQRVLLVVQGVLRVVAHLLAERTLLALGHAPLAQANLWLFGLVGHLELPQGVVGLLDGVLQGLHPPLQVVDELPGVRDLRLEAALQAVVPAEVLRDCLVVRAA
eukprot:CAMPEP_0179056706 /NCGR_PEP_ID=MMETSP0796-20121207/23951_1 /TAXON_ID=73915 /ORGANISM="Pyrodinium bahamense, Strain pbaha01" /LENGTH=429 /DNA_ID=CAMNT_0020753391 /DNA_START=42 /DNA_END=1332 /DNA_ORIENTATION=-